MKSVLSLIVWKTSSAEETFLIMNPRPNHCYRKAKSAHRKRTMGNPHFIIIGAQRCGTTSLYNYLIRQLGVIPAAMKEVHFFDLNYQKGNEWYFSQFPELGRDQITGEASPYYIFHPRVPQRIKNLLPSIKLIVLLRNPTNRAFSHYQLQVQ